jgi:hypothetical protein
VTPLQAYGYASDVLVQAWTAACYGCALPGGTSVPFLGVTEASPGAPLGYTLIDCSQGVQIRVSVPGGASGPSTSRVNTGPASGPAVQTLSAPLEELGAYTVLVHNTLAGPVLTLLVDAPGSFPYTALIVGGVVMCALAAASSLLRYALVSNGLIAPAAAGAPQELEGDGQSLEGPSHSALQRAVAFCSPVWHFLGYDTYARERAAAAAAASAPSSRATGGAEPLLPKDSFGGVNADAPASGDIEHQPAGQQVTKAATAARAADAALLARLANRIRSIDSFRGACLCFMIFFNFGGGGYWFMVRA